ncbi:MAG: rRNA maturation RNase YbeY [Planctomycetota bacterium]
MKGAARIQIEIAKAPRGLATVARRAAEFALASQGVVGGELSIAFVGVSEMKRLHAKWLGDDSPTDVMTFDLAESPSKRKTPVNGEIVICSSVARAQAAEHRVSHREELLRYVVHGCLHLCGYDDRRATDAKKMHAEQERVLARFLKVKK